MAVGSGREAALLTALVERGVISSEDAIAATAEAARSSVPITTAILALGLAPPGAVASQIAAITGLDRLDHGRPTFDPSLPLAEDLNFYLREGLAPWCRVGACVVFAVIDPWTAQGTIEGALEPGETFRMLVATRAELTSALNRAFGERLSEEAALRLDREAPDCSARRGLTLAQAGLLFGALLASSLAALHFPAEALIAASLLSGGLFALIMAFRLVLVGASFLPGRRPSHVAPQPLKPPPEDLPVYSVIVALYREAEVLPETVKALARLNYPKPKLDIILALEEDDDATRRVADELSLDGRFTVIVVPNGRPRTKPKALNYALAFARGDMVAIYDAEDRPDPDQLLAALAAHEAGGERVGAAQASLGFYNSGENWLTGQFTLEFALWFDFVLPGLERLGLPIPLGGTSNHFRRSVLDEVGAWDAFNVTEDADLGVRLTRRGYRVVTFRSLTQEEANCQTGNWIHQRSRWLKGYLQTYLVHMRRPGRLRRQLGLSGFLAFQLIIGGAIAAAVLHLLFWGLMIAEFAGLEITAGEAVPSELRRASIWLFALGNAIGIGAAALAASSPNVSPAARLGLLIQALTIPLYWFLISFAALKAIYSFAGRRFYWAKTRHGLSRYRGGL